MRRRSAESGSSWHASLAYWHGNWASTGSLGMLLVSFLFEEARPGAGNLRGGVAGFLSLVTLGGSRLAPK